MRTLWSHVDADGYSAEIVDESGEAVLVARRDTGEDVAVYLSPAAAEGFAASLLEWAGRA